MEQLHHVFEHTYHAINGLLIKQNCTFAGYRTSSDASTETLVNENASVSGNNLMSHFICVYTNLYVSYY